MNVLNLEKLKKNRPLLHLGPWQAVLLVILAFGLYATVIRYAQGLGAATHLSDQFPWGLWIGFDMLVGVGAGRRRLRHRRHGARFPHRTL